MRRLPTCFAPPPALAAAHAEGTTDDAPATTMYLHPISLDGAPIGLGLLLFGELPDGPTSLGTVIIILTGLYSLRREHRLRPSSREPARQAPADRD